MVLQLPSSDEVRKVLAHLISGIESISKLEKGTSRNGYIIKSKGRKYVLKLFEKENNKPLSRQIKQLRKINEKKEIVINPLNDKVLKFKKTIAYIYEYFEGEPYYKARINNKIRLLGEIAGTFDKQASKVIKQGKDNRFYKEVKENYDENKDYINELPNKEEVSEALEQGFSLLKDFKKKKYRTQLVHGDIHGDNVLYSKGKYLIIDADGVRRNNLIIEPVTMINLLLEEKNHDKKIKDLLEGYESKVKLTKEEKKAVPCFLILRNMNEVIWFVYQLKRKLISRKQYKEWVKHSLNRLKLLIKDFNKYKEEFEKTTS